MENRDSETIVCRCEDVTREMILACIADGYETLDEIKRVTRAGMGPCQGRTCRQLIAAELSRHYGVSMEEVLMTTFRPPAKPISLGVLADAYASENG
ncbi:MAG: (2Fe-2S)-binding protein [Oscillospiraceae bacterium]|nr:(2Fe-2S)-binding protein [Oscillospiraceae bacterium]